MDLFQYERKVRVYNIAKQICNVFSKFLGVNETVPQLKKHLKEEVEELLSAKNKKEMAFECADVIILCMRILIVSGYKDPLAIIDKKGKIVLNRLEKAVGIQMRTPGWIDFMDIELANMGDPKDIAAIGDGKVFAQSAAQWMNKAANWLRICRKKK